MKLSKTIWHTERSELVSLKVLFTTGGKQNSDKMMRNSNSFSFQFD